MEVEVKEETGTSLTNSRRLPRQTIVDAIDRGVTFVTAYLGQDGHYRRGEDVRIVEMFGARYIRTDNNRLQADNLDHLPEYL